MKIKQNLTVVNYNKANKTNKYIVVHYTANKTDTAYNNTKYFKSVNRNASANYFVDDNDIYQCVLDKDIAWHCGGNKLSSAGVYHGRCTNANSIGVEMCCTNSDVSPKTEANTVELVKYLMNKYNIPASNVIRHYDVTGKKCPKPFVDNLGRWNSFKAKLGGNANINIPTSKPISNPDITGDILYQVYSNPSKKWYSEKVNASDYAGSFGKAIGGLRAKPKYGEIVIQTHIKGGNWLSKISSKNYRTNDTRNGNSYSGIMGKPIDGVKIWSTKGHVDYRVHIKGGGWLSWINSNNSSGTGPNSYAGIIGKEIDAIQMK